MSDQIPFNESPDVAESKPEVGCQLRLAREARGLTIEQISARLNINSRYISALENDDFAVMPGTAFTRGYLRSYARLLDLDGDALVKAFNQTLSADDNRSVASITKVRRQASSSDPLIRIVGVALALALIGVSIWWWQTQSAPTERPLGGITAPADTTSAERDAKAQPEGVGEPAADADGAVSTAGDEEPVYLSEEEVARLARELDQPAEEEPVAPAAPTNADAAAADAPNQAETLTAAGEPSLVALQISFGAECWVTLKDAAGRTQVARIFKPAETLSIDVAPPAELLLGNASAVTAATLNGETLALASSTRQNVTRLTLRTE